MDGGIYSTGNAIVDENAKLNISGNVIPQMWYRTIVRESGKPNLTAIIILADIVYWYKPTELRDESSGQVVAVKKKFKADLLQRSYQQISEQFGISKKEATNAIIFLEKLGVVKRVFRTVNINGLVVNNVLYLELIVQKLRQLTYPQDSHNSPLSFERERGDTKREDISPREGTGGEIRTCEMGAVPLKSERVSPFEETPATLEDMEVPLLKIRLTFLKVEQIQRLPKRLQQRLALRLQQRLTSKIIPILSYPIRQRKSCSSYRLIMMRYGWTGHMTENC